MTILFATTFLGAWFTTQALVLGFCLWINHTSKRNQEFIAFQLYMEKQIRLAVKRAPIRFRHEMSMFRDTLLKPELAKYGLAIKEDIIPPHDHQSWYVRIIWADNPIYNPRYRGGRVEFMTMEGGSSGSRLDDVKAPEALFKQHCVQLDEYVRLWIMDARTWHHLTEKHKAFVAQDWARTTYEEMKVLADKKRNEEWEDMPRMFIHETKKEPVQ